MHFSAPYSARYTFRYSISLASFIFRFFTLLFAVGLVPHLLAGGKTEPPPIPEIIPCDDDSIIVSDQHYYNPLKAKVTRRAVESWADKPRVFRPTIIGDRALNYEFYAVLEGKIIEDGGKKFGVFPVYSWVKKHDGYQCVASWVEQQNYFDMCGCYVGSTCQPVNVWEETYDYVLTKRWVKWKRFCERMDDNPERKAAVLIDIKRKDTFGFLTLKGFPRDGMTFHERFREYAIEPDEDERIFNKDGSLIRKQPGASSSAKYTSERPGVIGNGNPRDPIALRKDGQGEPQPGGQGYKPPQLNAEIPAATAQEVREDSQEKPAVPPPPTALMAERVPGKYAVYSPYDSKEHPRREIDAINPMDGSPLPEGSRMLDNVHGKFFIIPKID